MQPLYLLLLSFLLLSPDTASAASYRQQNGSLVDPILDIFSNVHPYAGTDLEPSADLTGASLAFADLDSADLASALLVGADLTSADFDHADLSGADLTGAVLIDATLRLSVLSGTQLAGADLRGARLDGATGLDQSLGAALYSAETDFSGTGFDPIAAGWTLVPEPGAALLTGLGLLGLASRRPSSSQPA